MQPVAFVLQTAWGWLLVLFPHALGTRRAYPAHGCTAPAKEARTVRPEASAARGMPTAPRAAIHAAQAYALRGYILLEVPWREPVWIGDLPVLAVRMTGARQPQAVASEKQLPLQAAVEQNHRRHSLEAHRNLFYGSYHGK